MKDLCYTCSKESVCLYKSDYRKVIKDIEGILKKADLRVINSARVDIPCNEHSKPVSTPRASFKGGNF